MTTFFSIVTTSEGLRVQPLPDAEDISSALDAATDETIWTIHRQDLKRLVLSANSALGREPPPPPDPRATELLDRLARAPITRAMHRLEGLREDVIALNELVDEVREVTGYYKPKPTSEPAAETGGEPDA